MIPAKSNKRRISPTVWRAARALYLSDATLTLPRLGERFGLSLAAVKKRSSRERWLEGLLEAPGVTLNAKPVALAELVPVVTSVVTKENFRAFVREEATQLLGLLRRARLTAQDEPLEAARTIAPVLERLARVLEKSFEGSPRWSNTGTGTLLCKDLLLGNATLPRRCEESAEERPTAG